jgi:putative FmdB family regulatory protein
MPIYEYQCQDCHADFEIIRPMKDADSIAVCNKCQSQNTKRRISMFNASSNGRSIADGGGCSGCAGGACNTCGSH